MLTRRLWALLATCAFVLIGARVTVAAPEACPAPTAAEARHAAEKAAGWLIANQLADGSFRYQIDRAGNDLGGYSSVRHAGATLALYQVAAATNDDRTLAAADRATRVDARQPRDERRIGSRSPKPTAPRRSAGARLMLAALAERRARDGEHRVRRHHARAGRFHRLDATRQRRLLRRPTTRRRRSPIASRSRSTTRAKRCGRSPGCENALPDDSYRNAALRAADFVATERNDRDFVPVGPLNDHWATHGFAEMAAWPIGDAEADYARALAGRFASSDPVGSAEGQRRAVLVDARTVATRGRARHWVEGQAALAHLARTDHRLADLRDDTRASTECGAGLLIAVSAVATTPASAARGSTRGRAAWTTSNTRSPVCSAWPTCSNRSTR